MKTLLGKVIAQRVKNGETLGVGSGTSVQATLLALGKRIKAEKLQVRAVATSIYSARLAEESGLEVLEFGSSAKIDWGFDGADEVAPDNRLIKGRGGAMLLEKIVAKRCGGIVVIVTEEKLVDRLGSKCPVPIEVIPEAVTQVKAELLALGAASTDLRMSSEKFGPLVTEHNNFILDAKFSAIPVESEQRIKSIVGVVDSGLFGADLVKEVVIVRPAGIFSRSRAGEKETPIQAP